MLGTTFAVAKEHALLAECRLLLVGKFVCSLDRIQRPPQSSVQRNKRHSMAQPFLNLMIMRYFQDLSCTQRCWSCQLKRSQSLLVKAMSFLYRLLAQSRVGKQEYVYANLGCTGLQHETVRGWSDASAVEALQRVCTLPALRKRCFNIGCFGQMLAARVAG